MSGKEEDMQETNTELSVALSTISISLENIFNVARTMENSLAALCIAEKIKRSVQLYSLL